MFIVLLTNIVNGFNHTKCVSLIKNVKLNTVIDLHPNEQSQQLHYYTFVVKLDKYVGSCYTLNDPPNKVCVRNTAED